MTGNDHGRMWTTSDLTISVKNTHLHTYSQNLWDGGDHQFIAPLKNPMFVEIIEYES